MKAHRVRITCADRPSALLVAQTLRRRGAKVRWRENIVLWWIS